MPMDSTTYQSRLEADYVQLSRRINLMKTVGRSCLVLALALLSYMIWLTVVESWIITWSNPVTLALPILMFVAVVILFVISTVANCTQELWARELKHNQLRFDVYAADDDTLREVLGRHVAGYRSGVTYLNMAEELLREVEFQTNRRADISRRLVALYKDENLDLAKAVNRFVAQSLTANGIKDDCHKIETVLREIEESSVIPFAPRD